MDDGAGDGANDGGGIGVKVRYRLQLALHLRAVGRSFFPHFMIMYNCTTHCESDLFGILCGDRRVEQ